MSFYPKGFDRKDQENFSVHLTLVSAKRNAVKVQARISIVGKADMRPVGRIFKHTFKPSERKELNPFYTLESLFSDPYNCSQNAFVLECEIKLLETDHLSDCPLAKEMKNSFDSRKFTDLTLQIGRRTLEVHKFMLIGMTLLIKWRFLESLIFHLPARSQVFASILEVEMLESKENVLYITDFDFDVMQEIVRYIYTDQVENIENIAPSLLLAADKVRNF